MTRRNLLGLMAGTAGLALLSACGGQQPAAKPAEPAKPAESKPAESKPGAPAAAAQPSTAPAKPAEAAKPTAAPAVATGSQIKITLWSSFTAVNGDAQQAMVDQWKKFVEKK